MRSLGRGISLSFVRRVKLFGFVLRDPNWPVNKLREFSGGFSNFFEDLGRMAYIDYFLRVGGRE